MFFLMVLSNSHAQKENFEDTEVYFFGETHYHNANRVAKYETIKKLHNQYGVNDFVFEGSAIYVALVDHYVRTGKEHFLEKMKEISASTKSYFKGSSKFPVSYYENLRSLYVNSENKFHIHSIDNERLFTVDGLKPFLVEYSSDTIFTSLLSDILELRLDSITVDRALQVKDKKWLNLIEQNKDKAQKYYNKNIRLHSPRASLIRNLYLNEAIPNRTERNMAKNFANLKRDFGFKKCMIWFGNLHAQKKSGWLANRIEKQGYKVTSIALIYNNCYNFYFDKKSTSSKLSYLEGKKSTGVFELIKCNDVKKLNQYDYVKILDCE